MIIQYYADSLGLPKPGYVNLQQRYIYLFKAWLQQHKEEEIFLVDRAKGGGTIEFLYSQFQHDEEYIVGHKDLLIIHEGVVDCAPRPIPLRLRKVISALPSPVKRRIIQCIHKHRSGILKSGFCFYLTSKKKYKSLLKEWLENASAKYSRIYVLNIAPTNSQIEMHSPGFSQSIQSYNEIMREVIDDFEGNKVYLIDSYRLLLDSGLSLDDLIIKEDGHHITARAHILYANELIRLEMEAAIPG
jgi:hypothetical protein